MDKDMELMVEVLLSFGTPAYETDAKLESTAREWLEAGFSPDEAGQWLDVFCWTADAARKFADAELEPEDVSFETFYPSQSTLAHKASLGVIPMDVAIRIAKSRR